jgi:mRNA interferase RelE/StbE
MLLKRSEEARQHPEDARAPRGTRVSYAVFLHPKAAKELKKLEASIQERMTEHLRGLRENPEAKGRRLTPSEFWSLRLGDHRVIYQIDPDRRQVVVLFVGAQKQGV